MEGYCVGGLESKNSDFDQSMDIGGVKYIVSGKFKSRLRDTIIDWHAFLNTYEDDMTKELLITNAIRLLNIHDTPDVRVRFIDVLDVIYNLPASRHMNSMIQQYIIHEPVSVVVEHIFHLLKKHYEQIVRLFVEIRNKYIDKHEAGDGTAGDGTAGDGTAGDGTVDKKNNWDKLITKWNHANSKHKLESSSVILLFLNPPVPLKSHIHYKIAGKDNLMRDIKQSIDNFHYPGFCPRVPVERLIKLLTFPISKFVDTINDLNNSIDGTEQIKFPDYNKIEEKMKQILNEIPKRPDIKDEYGREPTPGDKKDIDLMKWYICAIFDLRKKIIEHSKQYESFYQKFAEKSKPVIKLLTDQFV
jgi:hypothetical protein